MGSTENYTINSIITNNHKNYANEFIVRWLVSPLLAVERFPLSFAARILGAFVSESLNFCEAPETRIGRGSKRKKTCREQHKKLLEASTPSHPSIPAARSDTLTKAYRFLFNSTHQAIQSTIKLIPDKQLSRFSSLSPLCDY